MSSPLRLVKYAPWSPFTVFAPPLAHQGDSVILSDAWRGKRVAIQRHALLDLLTASFTNAPLPALAAAKLAELGLFGEIEIDAETVRHAAHWWERCWVPSLDWYLWSRHGMYVDEHDRTGEQRRAALTRYIEQSQPPARIAPEGKPQPLPEPAPFPADITLGDLLIRRRTIRQYLERPVAAEVLSAVLWFGLQELRRLRELPGNDVLDYLRSYGVALDIYLALYSVEGLAAGIYFYDPARHTLVQIREGEFRSEMTYNLWDQGSPKTAGWTVLLVADFAQYQWRYRHERALQHLYFDAGRIAQRLLLVGGAYRLCSFPTPATRDQSTITLFGLDIRRQAPIYTLTMGLDKRFNKG